MVKPEQFEEFQARRRRMSKMRMAMWDAIGQFDEPFISELVYVLAGIIKDLESQSWSNEESDA
jgi:hypothetical protein